MTSARDAPQMEQVGERALAALSQRFRGRLVTPRDPDYDAARGLFNAISTSGRRSSRAATERTMPS